MRPTDLLASHERVNHLEVFERKVEIAEAECEGRDEHRPSTIPTSCARGLMRRFVDPSNELSVVGDTAPVSWNETRSGRLIQLHSVGDGTSVQLVWCD